MNLLVFNTGSATLKFKLFQMPGESVLMAGSEELHQEETPSEAVKRVLDRCHTSGIDAIGHRIVHGGRRFCEPIRVDKAVLKALSELEPLAPLHNPMGVALIRAVLEFLPGIPNVACFDTAFHQTLPERAWRYALPRDLTDRLGLRRYGFHGLSHQYISTKLLGVMEREPAGTRLIVCHLGNGASVCALRDGRSIDTSMGFTPLEGLTMGTRCGDIDPGLLLYLQREEGMSLDTLSEMLNHQSGLLGLSGRSADVRELESAGETDSASRAALDHFAYRVRKYIGAYAAALGGLDAVAFTGGIGEHSPAMRARICQGLSFLGMELDLERNQAAAGLTPARVSTESSSASIWVIPTEEERQIARNMMPLLTTESAESRIESGA